MTGLSEAIRLRLLALAGLAILLALLWLVLNQMGMPETLAPGALASWLDGQGLWGPLLLILLMILAVVVGPIPTLPVSAAAGLAFGILAGTLVAITGATLGALIAFWVSRLLARDYFRRKLGEHPLFAPDASSAALFWGVLLTRLIPLFSFALISYAAGLTAITAGRFALASVVGMLPMTFVFAGLGQTYELHPAWTALAAALLLAVMVVLPWYLNRHYGLALKRWLGARSKRS